MAAIDLLARLERLRGRRACRRRALHARRDVLHRDQHVQLEVRALQLLGGVLREEAVGDVVLLRRRHLLQLAERDVMVRQHEAARADERSRPAVVEANARQPQVVEPLRRRREAVLVAQLRERRVVERPHALVGLHPQLEHGQHRDGQQQDDESDEDRDSVEHRASPCEPFVLRPRTENDIVNRHAAHRSREESAGLHPQGSGRQDAPAGRLRRPARRPLLLPERRHAGLHQGSVRVSRQPAEVQDQQGRRPGRQRPRRGQQGEVRRTSTT